MTSLIIQNGNTFTPFTNGNGVRLDYLPAAYYAVKKRPMGGPMYLELLDELPEVPPKIYGSAEGRADLILETFFKRGKATGVMLHGAKGTGKTMLATTVADKAITKGMPVLLISDPFNGDYFNEFIASFKQPIMILFEEFDKVYADSDDINGLLTLLDGMHSHNSLSVFTTNDEVPEYMHNRPGRVYYSYNYEQVLEENVINEYLTDNLNKVSLGLHKEFIEGMASMASVFNFDMLKAIVEELNFYPTSTIPEILGRLNLEPINGYASYTYRVIYKGQDITRDICQSSFNSISLDMSDPLERDEIYFNLDAEIASRVLGIPMQDKDGNCINVEEYLEFRNNLTTAGNFQNRDLTRKSKGVFVREVKNISIEFTRYINKRFKYTGF